MLTNMSDELKQAAIKALNEYTEEKKKLFDYDGKKGTMFFDSFKVSFSRSERIRVTIMNGKTELVTFEDHLSTGADYFINGIDGKVDFFIGK